MEFLPILKQARLYDQNFHMHVFPYYVSDQGHVYNRHLKRLKPWLRGTHGTRYRTVRLKGRNVSISRIVASTFINTFFTDDRTEVDYINGNSLDDRAVNLRWVTRSENEKHKHKLKKERRKLSWVK